MTNNYAYRFTKCEICGKEFLVERILVGTDHTIGIIVSCKECLQKKPLPKEFVKERPEKAKKIMKWLSER